MSEQPELFGWTPPQAALAFDERQVRGGTLAAQLSRAVSVALQDAGASRRVIAQRMSDYLGEAVTPAMLDAYASVARDAHRISMPRFVALVHATGDRRLLEMLAQPMGWAVIERRHLPLIDLAVARERQDEVDREVKAIRRRARVAGGLR